MPVRKKMLLFIIMFIIIRPYDISALNLLEWPVLEKDSKYIAEKNQSRTKKDQYDALEEYTEVQKLALYNAIGQANMILWSANFAMESGTESAVEDVNKAIRKWIGPPDILDESNAEKLRKTREILLSMIKKLLISEEPVAVIPRVIRTHRSSFESTLEFLSPNASSSSSLSESSTSSISSSPSLSVSSSAPSSLSSSSSLSAYTTDYVLTEGGKNDPGWVAYTLGDILYEEQYSNAKKQLKDAILLLKRIKTEIPDTKYYIVLNNRSFYRNTLEYPKNYFQYKHIYSEWNKKQDGELLEKIETSNNRSYSDNMALVLLHECSHAILGTYDLNIRGIYLPAPRKIDQKEEQEIEEEIDDITEEDEFNKGDQLVAELNEEFGTLSGYDAYSITAVGSILDTEDASYRNHADTVLSMYEKYFKKQKNITITNVLRKIIVADKVPAYGMIFCRLFAISASHALNNDYILKENIRYLMKSKSNLIKYEELEKLCSQTNEKNGNKAVPAFTFMNADTFAYFLWDISRIK